MLVILSPAKAIDMDPVMAPVPSEPMFATQAGALSREAQKLSIAELQELMKISPKLAKLTYDRFRDIPGGVRKQAVFAFAGDTYRGLDVGSLDHDALRYAQDHLRILSGLYGLLRPMDAISPYRLEMGSKMKNAGGKNLYEFWGDKIAVALNEDAQASRSNLLLNCASQEYFRAVNKDVLNMPVITPVFLEKKPDKPARTIGIMAKKARGALARYVVENGMRDAVSLRDFSQGGYQFDEAQSTPSKLVFLRLHDR